MTRTPQEQDVAGLFWARIEAWKWPTPCASLEFDYQVPEAFDWAEVEMDLIGDSGSTAYAQIPESPEEGYVASATRRALKTWAEENPG